MSVHSMSRLMAQPQPHLIVWNNQLNLHRAADVFITPFSGRKQWIARPQVRHESVQCSQTVEIMSLNVVGLSLQAFVKNLARRFEHVRSGIRQGPD